MNATKDAWNGLDQKYKIAETSSELANKTKNAFMGLFKQSGTNN